MVIFLKCFSLRIMWCYIKVCSLHYLIKTKSPSYCVFSNRFCFSLCVCVCHIIRKYSPESVQNLISLSYYFMLKYRELQYLICGSVLIGWNIGVTTCTKYFCQNYNSSFESNFLFKLNNDLTNYDWLPVKANLAHRCINNSNNQRGFQYSILI